MASILVCYGTGEGQTEKVADRLADELTARGHDPTTVNVKAIESDPDIADAFTTSVEERLGDARGAG